MELTIKYQPKHYMALYHAGMAKYQISKSMTQPASAKEEAISYLHMDDEKAQ